MNKSIFLKPLLLVALLGPAAAAVVAEPAAPSNLTVVAVSANEVNLSWYDNAVDERGYTVQRSEDGISWDTVGKLSRDAGEFRDMALGPETHYVYRVFSHNSSGKSAASNQDAVVTPPLMDLTLDSTDFQVGSILR